MIFFISCDIISYLPLNVSFDTLSIFEIVGLKYFVFQVHLWAPLKGNSLLWFLFMHHIFCFVLFLFIYLLNFWII